MTTSKPKAPLPREQPGTEIVPADRVEEQLPEPRPAAMPPMLPPTGPSPGSTDGLSTLRLTGEQQRVLIAPVDPETEVEVRPDGVVFMPANAFRARLDDAVGPGNWALRQERDPFYDSQTEECCYDGSLWIFGKYVARAIGGCKWNPRNKQMTKSDAIEGSKSDCLRRCCKDLGIGRELWTPSWVREFVARFCEPYQGKDWNNNVKIFWRKIGQPLSGQALANATGLGGEFPLGFNSDSKLPDGELAGVPLKDVPEDKLSLIARNAKTVEWALAAKAELVKRRTAAAGSQPSGSVADDLLPEDDAQDDSAGDGEEE